VVVGGGPSGSTAAYELARAGHTVLLTEEHPRIGQPVQCAGLVSSRVLDLAGSRDMVLHEVRGATVWSPSMRPLRFAAPETRAYVISREGLDRHLADRAASAGAEVRTGWRFREHHSRDPRGPLKLRFRTPEGEQEVRARLVIGADGVTSEVARSFRLRRPVEILPAYEAEIPVPDSTRDEVEIYLGQRVSPGLFGWWIPDGFGGARVGLAIRPYRDRTARDYFAVLLDRVSRRYGRPTGSPVGIVVAGIPIGTVPHIAGDRVLLVGDAAGQVKPVSGGGIYTGMRGALLASRVAQQALAQDTIQPEDLSPYEDLWKQEFGAEFERALLLRRIFLGLRDEQLERVLEVLSESRLQGTIVAFGDIDFPSHVASQLLRQSPALVSLLPSAVVSLFRRPGRRTPRLDFGAPVS